MALKLNLNYVGKYADKEKFDSMRSEVSAAHKMLTEGTGLGSTCPLITTRTNSAESKRARRRSRRIPRCS